MAFGVERRDASVHSLLALPICRLFLAWSAVGEHNLRRRDLVMQTAVGRAAGLRTDARRLETGVTSWHAVALQEVLCSSPSPATPGRPRTRC